MKKVLAIVLVIVLALGSLFALSACGNSGSDWEYIKKKGYITVGYDNAFPPMGFIDEATGKDVGFDLDLAQAVGDYLKIEVKFQPIDWSTKEAELTAKNIDLIWNGYTITDKRKNAVNFSVPYLKNDQVLVIRKEDEAKYTSIASLTGASLLAQSGSTAVDVIANDDVLKNCKLSELKDNVMIMNELSIKYADAAVMDFVVANYILSQNNSYSAKLMVVESVSLEYEEYGIGIRKGADDTTEKINEALLALKKEGKLKELAEKWGLTDLLLV